MAELRQHRKREKIEGGKSKRPRGVTGKFLKRLGNDRNTIVFGTNRACWSILECDSDRAQTDAPDWGSKPEAEKLAG